MQEVAIIGPTASGKSALAIEIAKKCNAYILSLDSLSIYKEIDIASAKPTLKERKEVRHFGIDEIYPNEKFNVAIFFSIYKRAKEEALKNKKNLIIVGGSSFYLKAMTNGLSKEISYSNESLQKTKEILKDIEKAYLFIKKKDIKFASKITKRDRFRMEKWFNLFFEKEITLTKFFEQNPPKKIIENIPIFNIEVDRDVLRQRVKERTKNMIKKGIVDEAFYLEKKYTRAINPMKSIGIKESLEYLDGFLTLKELEDKIISNTMRLAKRQRTFNKTQFHSIKSAPIDILKKEIILTLCS